LSVSWRVETCSELKLCRGRYEASGQQRSDRYGNDRITEWRREELDLEIEWRIVRRRKVTL
jgi:hypothetical protein